MRQRPNRKRLLKHAERWRPYRTAAAWYLWRSLDIALPGRHRKAASEKSREAQEAVKHICAQVTDSVASADFGRSGFM